MKDFIRISRYAGMREDLVQAGGGNSSFKLSDEEMVIKSSGIQLGDISETAGYSRVNYKSICEIFRKTDDMEKLSEDDGKKILTESLAEGKRPSIETFLHAITGRYTLHTHPILVNAITCRIDGETILKKIFPNCLIVPYATPGIELAKAYYRAFSVCDYQNNTEPVFLLNHGLVVSGEDADEVIDRTEVVLQRINEYLGCDIDQSGIGELWRLFENRIVWKVTDIHVLRAYRSTGIWNHTFCPDCIVFLGKKVFQCPDNNMMYALNQHRERFGNPSVVEFKNELYIIADSYKKVFEIQSVLSFSAQVMMLNQNQECSFLDDMEMDKLTNWEAEKYRRRI